MKELEFIYKRRSVRRFKDAAIPREHLEAIIQAATAAPSGRNLQTWHFVVLTNKEKINEIVKIVERKNASLAEKLRDKDAVKAFKAGVLYHTIFKDAPTLVLVYAGKYPSFADDFFRQGLITEKEFAEYKRPNPAIQNISAAMENLLLAAAALGYGGCWMTGPTYAAREISEFIGFE